jgi:uncharacterized protein GlcG (DUF336 family)
MTATHARPAVTLEAANRILAAVIAGAGTQGLTVSAAVVDPWGVLVAFARMDGSAVPVATFAQDKAYTAATLGKPTREFGEKMTSKPFLAAGLATRDRLLCWPGGLPILREGAVIGGLGISGASDEEDEALGALGLAAL